MEKQSFIQSICSITGMSKRSLAGFVDASPSNLTRYDDGSRGLPAKFLLLLAKMYAELRAAAEHSGPAPSGEEITELQEQAAWCLAQCHPQQKKLEAMKLSYRQGRAVLALLDKLAAENSSMVTPKKQRWMDEQYFVARKKCSANGWAAQTKLSTAIALLKYEAAMLKAEAERFSKQKLNEQ
jgi:hypothetical protein